MASKVTTFSFCLPPHLHKRWQRFSKDCGLSTSQSMARFMSSFLDAFEEAEVVPDAKEYRKTQRRNSSVIHVSETGLKIAVSLEESFVIKEQ